MSILRTHRAHSCHGEIIVGKYGTAKTCYGYLVMCKNSHTVKNLNRINLYGYMIIRKYGWYRNLLLLIHVHLEIYSWGYKLMQKYFLYWFFSYVNKDLYMTKINMKNISAWVYICMNKFLFQLISIGHYLCITQWPHEMIPNEPILYNYNPHDLFSLWHWICETRFPFELISPWLWFPMNYFHISGTGSSEDELIVKKMLILIE